jgi:hypothetical protein
MRLIVPRLYRTGKSAVVEVTDRPLAPQRSPQFAAAFGSPATDLEPSEENGPKSDAASPDGRTTDLSYSKDADAT